MNHYKRGYEAERRCVKKLEGLGYIVLRSGGSKKIDVVAMMINDWRRWPVGILVKRVGGKLKSIEYPVIRAIMVTLNKTKAKRNADYKYLKDLPLPTIVSKECWIYHGVKRKEEQWEIINVNDED